MDMMPRSLHTFPKSGYSLTRQEDDEIDEKGIEVTSKHSRWQWHLIVTLLACYSIAITVAFARHIVRSRHEGPNLINSPTTRFMNYGLKDPVEEFHDGYHGHPLFGDPSIEFDLAWIERMLPANIRLSAEEFSHYNQKGILLADNSGYLATPTVYHNIHCLRYLHMDLYSDYYYANETIEETQGRREHFRHCLNNIYYALTCNPDMTMRVMKWVPHSIFPAAVDNVHQCMNWETIDTWARERVVNTSTPGLLIHPTKGDTVSNEESQ